MLSMIGNEEQNSTNIRIFVPFNTMRELFPLKGDNSKEGNAISFINYQPRSFDENEAAKDELHRIVARNHGGFDPKGKDIWEEWDTVKNQKTMGKIFTAMDWFLGGVRTNHAGLGRDRHHQHHAGRSHRNAPARSACVKPWARPQATFSFNSS